MELLMGYTLSQALQSKIFHNYVPIIGIFKVYYHNKAGF